MDKKVMVMFIDDSALKDIFEGKNKGKSKELMTKLKEIKEKKMPIQIICPISTFLRAIWLADPKVSINSIQKTLSFLNVFPSPIDFKDEEAVKENLIELAGRFSKEIQNEKK